MDGAAIVLLKSVSSVLAAFSVVGEDAFVPFSSDFSTFSDSSGLVNDDTAAEPEEDPSMVLLSTTVVLATEQANVTIQWGRDGGGERDK